jgi:hypothetical protein
MTTADETTQRIVALQKRLVELDRERDNVLADIAKLERLRETPPSPATMTPAQSTPTIALSNDEKALCFARCSGAVRRISSPMGKSKKR